MNFRETIAALFESIPTTNLAYKQTLINSLKPLESAVNGTDDDLDKEIIKEITYYRVLREVSDFALHLSMERRIFLESERIGRARNKQTLDPITHAEELEYLRRVEEKRIMTFTNREGESGLTKSQEKAYYRLIHLGFSKKDAREKVKLLG